MTMYCGPQLSMMSMFWYTASAVPAPQRSSDTRRAAGREGDVRRPVALDGGDVLVHGVRRAGVPEVLGHALARRQDVEALVALRPEEVPAALQVPDQAVRLVLRCHADAPYAGVERIR